MQRNAPLVLVGIAIVLASCVTALFAHVIVDVLGDVMLSTDTYDRVAHGSRGIVLAGVGFALALASLRLWFAVCADARRSRSAMRAIFEAASRRSAHLVTILATIGLGIATMAGMEVFDAFRAGDAPIGLHAAFGGSLVLGFGVSIVVGALAAFGITFALRALAFGYAFVVGVAREAILAIARVADDLRATIVPRRTPNRYARETIALHRAAKRGPPMMVRLA